MPDSTIALLPDGVTAESLDRLPVERSPFGTGTNRYITPAYLATLFQLSGVNTGDQTSIAGITGSVAQFNAALTGGDFLTTASAVTVGQGGTGLASIADAAILATNAANVLTAVTAGASQSIRRNAGNTAWEAFTPSAGGGASWDTITAAAGDGSTDNGDNLMVYRVAKTTNTENSFRFTESAAATGGTSTSGVPNQVLLRVDTIAASTMSPLSIYSRAAHVVSASPTTAQLFATSGTAAAPPYSFAAEAGTGMSYVPNYLTLSRATVAHIAMGLGFVYIVPTGSATAPPLTNWDHGTTGLQWPANHTMIVCNSSDGEWARFITRAFQVSRGSADATAYAINARKARGTVASPTVITTGDDLLTLSGFGYVGATGLYVEACRITFDSTGTIANTTSGVGGIMRLSAAVVGTVGPVEIAQVNGTEQHFLHVGTVPTITAGGGTGPTIAGTDEAFTITAGTGGIASSVEVTFAKAFTVAPRCSSNHEGVVLVTRCVSTTTTVTIDAATPFTASGKITVICRSGTT